MNSLDNYMQALDRLFEQGLIDAIPSPLTARSGETIFHAEEPAPSIFGIQTGKIQLMRYLEDGHVSHQYAVRNGAWFGEDGLFKSTYQNSAIATQPSQIIVIPIPTFLTLLRHEPELSLTFMRQLSEQLHIAKTIMTLRCIRSAYDRVLSYLNTITTVSQRTIVLDSSIKEIAEHICLAPEVVSRSLRKLQDNGVIRRNQRKITFL